MYQYVTHARIDGDLYKINTDFKVAVKCLQLIEDPSVSEMERAIGVITMLFGKEAPLTKEAMAKAHKFLTYGNDESKTPSSAERDIDFTLDQRYIVPSIRKDYQIDITKQDLHWHEFIDLLTGLSEKALINSVRRIRTLDLSTVKDTKQRQELAKAKKQFALPIKRTKEEEQALSEFMQLLQKKGE